MSRVAINTGSVANDGTGDSLRIAGGKINDNFIEIYNQFGNGSNLTPTWNKTAAGVNTTSNVGVGTTNPRFTLEVGSVGASGTSLLVNGNARISGILTVGSSSIILDGSANKILVGSGVSIDGNTGIISATAFYAGGSIISGAGSGGVNYWGSAASGISTTANVAIGTVTPTSKLTVVGNSLFSGIATFRSNLTLANLTSSSNTLRFGSNTYIDQSNSNVFTFQIDTGTDDSSSTGSFVFRNTEPGISPFPDIQLDALRVYSSGDYWNRLVRVYTNFHADNNAFVGGNLQVGAASTLIGVGNTLGSFKVGAGGTVITTTSTGLVGIGTTNPTSALTVTGNALVIGVVTATTFVGALVGTSTTATNLADAANITTGTINSSRLSGNYNINVTGTASTASFATTSFGLTGAPNIIVGTIDGSSIKITGISTLGTIQISSGIVTATSGIVTYYGDTSYTASGRWTLGASGFNDYTFTGIGFTQTTNDPVLYLARGRVYEFVNNSGGGHPFEIRTSNGGSAYGNGVTNNAAASGIIRFEIPFNAPNTLYYQCTNHSGMGNTISVYPSTI
jgi:hypothetical protein